MSDGRTMLPEGLTFLETRARCCFGQVKAILGARSLELMSSELSFCLPVAPRLERLALDQHPHRVSMGTNPEGNAHPLQHLPVLFREQNVERLQHV